MKFTRFTSVLALTLGGVLAACDAATSPTAPTAPLSSAGTPLASAKEDAQFCQAHWQETGTFSGTPFRNVGDCIKYGVQGGLYLGEPVIWYVSQISVCDGGVKTIGMAISYQNGTGVIDYGTGPQPYASNQQLLLDGASPPMISLTVTNDWGQVASLQYQPVWPPQNPCG